MGTRGMDFWLYDSFMYGGAIKETFGNRKNYERWVEIRKFNNWTNWLISLGWR